MRNRSAGRFRMAGLLPCFFAEGRFVQDVVSRKEWTTFLLILRAETFPLERMDLLYLAGSFA